MPGHALRFQQAVEFVVELGKGRRMARGGECHGEQQDGTQTMHALSLDCSASSFVVPGSAFLFYTPLMRASVVVGAAVAAAIVVAAATPRAQSTADARV